MVSTDERREAIVDAAIALGERGHWEAVRLHDVAAELEITLDDIRQHFREKEDVVEAWFDRADGAMLCAAEADGFALLPARERLFRLVMAWFDALAPHRGVTRQMIAAKFEPGHVHIQVPALMRVSRTVQWVREAAGRDATFARRALEESALTTIYLMSFFLWLNDASAGSVRTRRFLERNLACAERADRMLWRCSLSDWLRPRPSRPPASTPSSAGADANAH